MVVELVGGTEAILTATVVTLTDRRGDITSWHVPVPDDAETL